MDRVAESFVRCVGKFCYNLRSGSFLEDGVASIAEEVLSYVGLETMRMVNEVERGWILRVSLRDLDRHPIVREDDEVWKVLACPFS